MQEKAQLLLPLTDNHPCPAENEPSASTRGNGKWKSKAFRGIGVFLCAAAIGSLTSFPRAHHTQNIEDLERVRCPKQMKAVGKGPGWVSNLSLVNGSLQSIRECVGASGV